jgi:(p)ppGpp synthase/HD superfamily hydrolase
MTLEHAIDIAVQAHRGQTRRNGEPYVLHPLRVMTACRTDKARIVAVLHDVVEDSDTTLQDLRDEGFDQDVLEALDLVTHEKGVPYDDYIDRIADNPLAREVKIADLEDNLDLTQLPKVSERDLKRTAKYHLARRKLLTAAGMLH